MGKVAIAGIVAWFFLTTIVRADAQLCYDAGSSKDWANALLHCALAAEQGDAEAQTGVAWMYHNGIGVEQNFELAAKWYTAAAKQGAGVAQANLGLMYFNGTGVEQDYASAEKWYTAAADQGLVTAQNNLGTMYVLGDGVTQDYERALKWYTAAAVQGDGWGQINLSVMYKDGKAVEEDLIVALMWAHISKNNAVGSAYVISTDLISSIESRLSEAEVLKAHELANKCVLSRYRLCGR